VPIIQEDEKPFSMFKDLDAAFGNASGRMLTLLKYPSPIIEPAQLRAEELKARKNAPLPERDARSYLAPPVT
jgi:hypothetical protein